MTRLIGITSSLFLGIALLLPSSMASAELAGACLKDAKAMCPGVVPGGGKIRDCLKTNLKGLLGRVQGRLGQGRKRQGMCG